MSKFSSTKENPKNLSKVGSTHSDEESDSSDDGEKDFYKNLSPEQLQKARDYNECFICQKRLSTFSTFRSHVLQHRVVEKKHQCFMCLKEFAKESYLKAHLTSHDESRMFTCEICSKNFVTKSSIRGHMRIHTDAIGDDSSYFPYL
ncbi:Zinc finger and BTB domain-containing protein 45 [Pseudolycoriella hygida]|uniref:Zinc finger and BTB domain-containing protein 45 n=1 Tax=Pseudolycoriella hygida TaxID=35572 RepID=A0A9Q0MSJ4_9DIPT|nr:Zinc finger and BTB domain-containing protein 45 [Pseudolycoriella hygida]